MITLHSPWGWRKRGLFTLSAAFGSGFLAAGLPPGFTFCAEAGRTLSSSITAAARAYRMAVASLGSMTSRGATQSGKVMPVCLAQQIAFDTLSRRHRLACGCSETQVIQCNYACEHVISRVGICAEDRLRNTGTLSVHFSNCRCSEYDGPQPSINSVTSLDLCELTCFSNLALMESGRVGPMTSGGLGAIRVQGRAQWALEASDSREVARLKRSSSSCTACPPATATTPACSFRKVSSLCSAM